MIAKPFTVCCLLFGDYPKLAERLLRSLHDQERWGYFDLRLGLNAVSQATLDAVNRYSARMPMTIMTGSPPYYKYPMMRQLFHKIQIESPYTMWFDDDSWLLPDSDDGGFFAKIFSAMSGTDMLGALYLWPHMTVHQRHFVEDQPWYSGLAVPGTIKFITGGWWTIRTEILKKHAWPIQELQHDGGDVMLGALCHQQGYRIRSWQKGVAINANDKGQCSKAKRRGASGKTARCGSDYRRTYSPNT